jgi:hypothetical protein
MSGFGGVMLFSRIHICDAIDSDEIDDLIEKTKI